MTRRIASLALAATLLGACAPTQSPAAPPDPAARPPVVQPLPGASLVVVAEGSDVPATALPVVSVDISATVATRQRGLSGRRALADGRGMLFVYADSRARRFWMKDCIVALDIAFLDVDGRILDIATLPPGIGLTGEDVPAFRSEGDVRYVLEVRAQLLGELGITVGDVVDLRRAVEGVLPE